MDTDNVIVYIKTEITYVDIEKEFLLLTRFLNKIFTPNYELDRPLPKGKKGKKY